MAASRRAIMQALFDTLYRAYAFKAGGRRLVDPDNVPSDKRPALYVVRHDDEFKSESPNQPRVVEILAWAIVYIDVPRDADGLQDHAAITEDIENDILDAIEAAIAPSASDDGRQTLGGLVYACNIEGLVERASGDVSGKGMFAVPIKLLRP